MLFRSDMETILTSVTKTGRLIAADTGWKIGGFGSEILASVAEQAFESLKAPPRRIGLADCPIPASQALSNLCYPRAADLSAVVCELLGTPKNAIQISEAPATVPLDVPDASFSGPF